MDEITLNCFSSFPLSHSGQFGLASLFTKSSCSELQLRQINSYIGIGLKRLSINTFEFRSLAKTSSLSNSRLGRQSVLAA